MMQPQRNVVRGLLQLPTHQSFLPPVLPAGMAMQQHYLLVKQARGAWQHYAQDTLTCA